MDKKTLFYIIEWVIALAACVYLAYRLVTYENYSTLWATLCGMEGVQICALAVCVALMPVNMALEAWRWKTLIHMSWRDARLQVYYSKLAGLVTPWRLGEYPARGLLMEKSEWGKVLSMGAVGSATMTAAIVLAGVMALNVLAFLGELGTMEHDSLAIQAYRIFVIIVLLALAVALALTPRLLRRWADVPPRLILLSLGQSLVRLLCWCVQLWLVLFALGGLEGMDILYGLGKTAVYYLLVTVTPNVPIAEAGVRGVWAIAVFGSMNAAFAGVLLWAVNTLLPCLIWPIIRKKQ